MLSSDVCWAEMERKIDQYHAFGVDAVWVIDPRMLALRVYARGGRPVTLQRDDEVRANHPAGFSCRVAEIFA